MCRPPNFVLWAATFVCGQETLICNTEVLKGVRPSVHFAEPDPIVSSTTTTFIKYLLLVLQFECACAGCVAKGKIISQQPGYCCVRSRGRRDLRVIHSPFPLSGSVLDDEI